MKNFLPIKVAVKAAVIVLCLALSQSFAATKPLLLDGKQNLYQRVLSRSAINLSSEPNAAKTAAEVAAFSVFYVYAKKMLEGEGWVQVGTDIHGNVLGWANESDLISWNQGLTVTFKNPIGGERALLFDSKKSIKDLIAEPQKQKIEGLYQAAVKGEPAPDSPVVAIQPDYHVDMTREFYLAPILDYEDLFYGDGEAKLLRIATATQQREVITRTAPEPAEPEPAAPEPEQTVETSEVETVETATVEAAEFTSGVVFVVDTTLSMGPYIDRTQAAIRKIYRQLTAAEDTGKVRFGLVGFRDQSADKVDLGYLSKTFASLQQGIEEAQFFDAVAGVAASTVSSIDFREDAYAGVKTALDEIDWNSVDARYIVLITDAGPRDSADERSSTRLDHKALQQIAQQKNIALTALHLLTPQGAENHDVAAEAYKQLSDYPGIGSLYFDVEAGDVDAFGDVVDALTEQISLQVKTALASHQEKQATQLAQLEPQPEPEAEPQPETPPAETTEVAAAAPASQLELLRRKFSRLGNALRMQYLKRDEEKSVPDVFNAWVLDRSLNNPEKKMLDVGVLLTRDQLGEMHSALNNVMETFEDGLIAPRGFLEDIKKLAATISRDPEALVDKQSDFDLASMGWMQEYIEDLPYQSQALTISLDDWENWSVKKQLGFIHQLQEKIAYYQAVYEHTDMWFSPAGGPVNGDSVIALSLEMLP